MAFSPLKGRLSDLWGGLAAIASTVGRGQTAAQEKSAMPPRGYYAIIEIANWTQGRQSLALLKQPTLH